MSSLITLNQSNVSPTQTNVYAFNFPSGSVSFKGAKVAVQSVIIPYSWYNVSNSVYNNAKLTLTFPITDGAQTKVLNLTIPDGFYSIAQLNQYLQSQMIANNVYLVNAAGSNVYYIEIVANLNLNVAQLNCYVVPNTLPSGYTNPGSWSLPSAGTRVPQLTTLANSFPTLIGFAPSTIFPTSSTQGTTYSISSTIVPQITPITSLYMGTSLVHNNLSNPTNVICNIPITSSFATQIIYSPNELIWLPILDGNQVGVSCIFYDQFFNQLPINDTNLTINLLIKLV